MLLKSDVASLCLNNLREVERTAPLKRLIIVAGQTDRLETPDFQKVMADDI